MSNPIVTIEMENGAQIKAELYPEIAPNTVNNFVSLVKKGFYDGVIFHRVIDRFMIQTGGYYIEGNTLMEKEGAKTIKGEFASNGVENTLKHKIGVLSMARTNDPNSASGQFFICSASCAHLDGAYAAFGKVIDGFEEGLIGVNIGDTVDLNLTFPKNYQNTELAGAAVVFTVTVNYVKTDEKRDAKDYFKEIGFKSLDEYNADVKKRAARNYLYNTVVEKSKVNDYPESEQEKLLTAITEYYDTMYKQYYGADLETVLSSSGMTMDDFRKQMITNTVSPMMKAQMVLYSIIDNEGIEISEKALENQQAQNDVLKESGAVEETVLDWLYDNAKIK